MKVIIDFETGTVVGADSLFLLDTDQFTEHELEDIYNGTLPGDSRIEAITGFTTEAVVLEDI
jgi:hypothetical protein